MIPEWVEFTEKRFGDSDPNGNMDTFNRANKQNWGNLTAYSTAPALGTGEHDRDGAHMSDLTSNSYQVDAGTYTGNGTDDRDISLSKSIDIKFIRIWEGSTAGTWFKTASMTGDSSLNTAVMADVTDCIQSLTTQGEFQVGTTLNVNMRAYYFAAYGET